MPITTVGTDIALQRNPVTGKFGFRMAPDGNPTMTNSQEHAVLSQLVEHLGVPGSPGWWADVVGEHGSRLYTIKHDKAATKSQIEEYATEALVVLEKRGQIILPTPPSPRARATRVSAGKYDLQVFYSSPDGVAQAPQVRLTY